ncbi:MAG: CPBP family intramembrane metalloprotease [Parachlamydiales bacterium]|nr:CPBP family intramembrane metalloprotease [Parachlamydiales bacterium]
MKTIKTLSYTFVFTILYTMAFYLLNKFLIVPHFENSEQKVFITLFFLGFSSLYMWIPGLVALFFAKKEKIKLLIFQKKFNRFYFYAVFAAIIFTFLTILISLPFAKLNFSVGLSEQLKLFDSIFLNFLFSFFVFLTAGLFFGVTINTFFGLGEEIMWRGYLFEKFQKFGFWKMGLFIGIIWGLWYAPLILTFGYNIKDHRILACIFMIIFTILSSPVFLYFKIKGKAIIVPALLHGSINAINGLSIAVFADVNRILIGSVGITGFVVWILFDLYIYLKKDTLRI